MTVAFSVGLPVLRRADERPPATRQLEDEGGLRLGELPRVDLRARIAELLPAESIGEACRADEILHHAVTHARERRDLVTDLDGDRRLREVPREIDIALPRRHAQAHPEVEPNGALPCPMCPEPQGEALAIEGLRHRAQG